MSDEVRQFLAGLAIAPDPITKPESLTMVEADPIELTAVIGHGVSQTLSGGSGLTDALVISQPQDRYPGRHDLGLKSLVDAIRGIGA